MKKLIFLILTLVFISSAYAKSPFPLPFTSTTTAPETTTIIPATTTTTPVVTTTTVPESPPGGITISLIPHSLLTLSLQNRLPLIKIAVDKDNLIPRPSIKFSELPAIRYNLYAAIIQGAKVWVAQRDVFGRVVFALWDEDGMSSMPSYEKMDLSGDFLWVPTVFEVLEFFKTTDLIYILGIVPSTIFTRNLEQFQGAAFILKGD